MRLLTELLVARDLRCEREGRMLFDSLSLPVRAGELWEVVGRNGAGKSTLLRILVGLYPDFEGTVQRPGAEAGQPTAYLSHRAGLNPLLSAEENLAWYHATESGAPCTSAQVDAALERVGLGGYGAVPVQHLSAGQQRRVALARLLLSSATLWLLDEPLTALDAQGAVLLNGVMQQHLQRGGAAVIATHASLNLHAHTLRLGSVDASP